jgi:hypothetical protein
VQSINLGALSFTEQAADVASRLRRGEAELMGSRGSERGEFNFVERINRRVSAKINRPVSVLK